MKIMRILSLFIAACIVGVSAAQAVEFRLLNWDGYDADLKFTNKGKPVPVSANENDFSIVYKYNEAGPIIFYKEVRLDEKTVKETAATVPVPADMTHGILILAATDSTLKTYVGLWVDDSPESRPAGTIRFVNLSSHPTVFKLGNEQFSITPSGTHQVKFDPAVQRVVLQGAAQVNNEWVMFSGNPIPVRPGLRLLVVLRDGRPSVGRDPTPVDLLSFYDRPPVPPTAPAGGSPL